MDNYNLCSLTDESICEEPMRVDSNQHKIEIIRGLTVLPGGIASLISQLTRTMRMNRATIQDIAAVQRSVCEQFGIYLPDCFDRSKESQTLLTRTQLEQELEKIYTSDGPKEWLLAQEIKEKYPEFDFYSVQQIGTALARLGIPSKKSKGYKRFLMTKKTDGEQQL